MNISSLVTKKFSLFGTKIGIPGLALSTFATAFLARCLLPCNVTGHRKTYHSAHDETSCRKCSIKWRDNSYNDDTRAGVYTPKTGWVLEKN